MRSTGALAPCGPRDYEATAGRALLADLGIDADLVERSRRIFARDCLDWSQRRPHLSGALPAALLTHFLERQWATRRRTDRGLDFTETGRAQLLRHGLAG